MFPEFNDSAIGKKKQKAMGDGAGGKCPTCGAKIRTATLITESNTESQCWEGKWKKKNKKLPSLLGPTEMPQLKGNCDYIFCTLSFEVLLELPNQNILKSIKPGSLNILLDHITFRKLAT